MGAGRDIRLRMLPSGVVSAQHTINFSHRAVSGTGMFTLTFVWKCEAIPSLCPSGCLNIVIGWPAFFAQITLRSPFRSPLEGGQRRAPCHWSFPSTRHKVLRVQGQRRKAQVCQRGAAPRCTASPFFAAVRGAGLPVVLHLASCLLVRRFRTRGRPAELAIPRRGHSRACGCAPAYDSSVNAS